jgi:predicted Fe-Mo cluster-binding NifX family protein
MKALAITFWNGLVSPLFDSAAQVLIIGPNESRRYCDVHGATLFQKVDIVQKSSAGTLICGAISAAALSILQEHGVRVIPWISGPVDDVLRAYECGKLGNGQFAMPGCRYAGSCRHRQYRKRSDRHTRVSQTSPPLEKWLFINERDTVKIAISACGTTSSCAIDLRFGRAGFFMIYDDHTNSWHSVDNAQNMQAGQGAGIQSAAAVVNAGAAVLISGHCGPKAFAALSKAGVAVYTIAGGLVCDALTVFKRGELRRMEIANVEGHW